MIEQLVMFAHMHPAVLGVYAIPVVLFFNLITLLVAGRR